MKLGLGKAYLQLGEYVQALDELKSTLEVALQSGQQYQLHDIYLELANVHKSMGNFDKALDSYIQFHDAKESIINLQAATKFKNLEMVSRVESKEKEVEIHRLKNIELRDKNRSIKAERQKSDALLLNILPRQTANELKRKGKAAPRQYQLATVLFCDFVSFTHTAELLTAGQLVTRLDEYFGAFDAIVSYHRVEKIKTIGDAYMAVGGVPEPNSTNPVDVVKAALEILKVVESKNDSLFRVRIGVHSGPLVAGIVGLKKFAYDVWGDTVNIASRMESSGEAGRVNISGTTYDLVRDHFHCSYRGKIEAKKKGLIDMFFVDA